MKQKIKHLLILITFPSTLIFGQADFLGLNNSLMDPYDMNRILANGQKNKIDIKDIEGSPYEEEKFLYGKAINDLTKDSKNFYFRYNAFNDEIQMKANLDDKEIYGLVKSLNIYAVVNNKEYHYLSYSEDSKINEGYFILISKDLNNHLFLRKTKKFKQGKPAKDSFRLGTPPAFKDANQFYYKKGRVLFPLPKKKKEILDHFSDKKAELKKFMKQTKINLENEKDVVKLLKHYESLT